MTSPRSVTIPVNISNSFETFEHIFADRLDITRAQPRRRRDRGERHPLKRVDAVIAKAARRPQNRGLIDEIGGNEGRRHDWPTLNHEAGDAARRKAAQRLGEIEASAAP